MDRSFSRFGSILLSVLLALLATAANTTWMARVAGRDHRGRVDAGTKQGLLDFIATAFGIS